MNDPDGEVQAHTVRLELVDEPGELLRALEPIAANGGNLLSIFHERGNITPRGHIPVEVDLEATPDQYEAILEGLHEAGIAVVRGGTERYSESVTVILSGHLVESGLSNTLTRIRETGDASITSFSLSAPAGTEGVSSARLKLAVAAGRVEETMAAIHDIAAEKGLGVVEPLAVSAEW